MFSLIVNIAAVVVDAVVLGRPVLQLFAGLALLLPGLAVSVRRLHDTGRSGWWYFILLIPLVGVILFIVWAASDSTPGENQYGRSPKQAHGTAPGYGY